MTSIQLFISAEGRFVGFKAQGHTGYARHGEDIVCAGVSTLIQTTALGLEKIVRATLNIKAQKETGCFLCELTGDNSQAQLERADLLLRNMYLGLTEMSKTNDYYKYLHVSIKEVE